MKQPPSEFFGRVVVVRNSSGALQSVGMLLTKAETNGVWRHFTDRGLYTVSLAVHLGCNQHTGREGRERDPSEASTEV